MGGQDRDFRPVSERSRSVMMRIDDQRRTKETSVAINVTPIPGLDPAVNDVRLRTAAFVNAEILPNEEALWRAQRSGELDGDERERARQHSIELQHRGLRVELRLRDHGCQRRRHQRAVRQMLDHHHVLRLVTPGTPGARAPGPPARPNRPSR